MKSDSNAIVFTLRKSFVYNAAQPKPLVFWFWYEAYWISYLVWMSDTEGT